MKKILLASTLAVTVYSGSWYYLTDVLQKQSEHFLTNLETETGKVKASFQESEKFGFPFKLGVRFKGVSLSLEGFNIKTNSTFDMTLSTTLLAKVYTLQYDSSETSTLSFAGKPLASFKTVKGAPTLAIGFRDSPLWKSLTSREEGHSLAQSFTALKDEGLRLVQQNELEPGSALEPGPSQKQLSEISFVPLAEKALKVLDFFEFFEFNVDDYESRYTLHEDHPSLASHEKEGTFFVAESYYDKYVFDKARLEKTKIHCTSKHKNYQVNPVPFIGLISTLFEKSSSPFSKGNPKNQLILTQVIQKFFQEKIKELQKQGPSQLNLDMIFETQVEDGDVRSYNIDFKTFEQANNFYTHSVLGQLEGALGHGLSFKSNVQGSLNLKPAYTESVKESLLAQSALFRTILPHIDAESLDKIVSVLLEGIDTLGPIDYKLKADLASQGDIKDESSPFTLQLDDFYFKTKNHGGLSLQGSFKSEGKMPEADGTLTLYKSDTLVDGLSKKTSDIFKALRDPDQPAEQTTHTFAGNIKRLLKALDTSTAPSEDVTVSLKITDGNPEISGKSWLEAMLLWGMISQENAEHL